MNKSGMLWLGIGGFVSGILFGAICLAFPKQDGDALNKHPSEVSRRSRHQRSGSMGVTRNAELQVFLHYNLAGLSPDQQARIRTRLAPLLREISTLGIGEYAYSDLATLAMSEVARENPEAAFRHLMEQGGPSLHGEFFDVVLHEWMLQDSRSAEAAVADVPPGERKDFLERTLFRLTMSTDPAKALELLKMLRRPSPPDYYQVFMSLAKNGVESAIQRAGEITDASSRASAIAGIAAIYASERSDKAWDWALTQEGEAGIHATTSVLTKMMKTDPASAVRKIESIQSPTIKGRIMGSIIQNIAWQSPEAAYHLLNANLSGYSRFCALSVITGTDLDEERLPQIKAMVENEPVGKYRDDLAANLAQNWAQTDPTAAYEWLKENGDPKLIPEDLRDQLSHGKKIPGKMESGIHF